MSGSGDGFGRRQHSGESGDHGGLRCCQVQRVEDEEEWTKH